MADVFQIAPLNPLRFVDLTSNVAWPEVYHSKPFDLEFFQESIFEFQTKTCFFQKWQTNDTTQVQIWSDFPIDSITLYNYDTGLNFDITPVDTGLTFPDFSFSVYEFELHFSTYGTGRAYIEIIYTDGGGAPNVWQSDPFWIADKWEETLLIEYKNDENDFSIIFDTGIEFSLRVDGILDHFQPRSERIVYNDQIRNATLLYGVPFREFRLNVGGGEGVPDWLADKLTRILDCNEVKIDGEWYVVAEGAEAELNRNDDYPLVGYRILVNQVFNRFNQRLKPGVGENGEQLKMILKAISRNNIAADQVYSGVVRKYTVLHALELVKYSVDPVTLLVGTTAGGSDISGLGGFVVDESKAFIEINYVFDAPQDVYVSGLTGAQVDLILFYYDPLDTSTGGGDSGSGAAGFVKGTVYMYEEAAPGDFAREWDISTGLGVIGTPYEGCALMDGRNGCGAMSGKVPLMFGDYTDQSGAYSYARGQTVGVTKHALVEAENGPHHHTATTIAPGEFGLVRRTKVGERRTCGDVDTENAGTEPDVVQIPGPIPISGAGTPHENRQPSFGLVFFKKITD